MGHLALISYLMTQTMEKPSAVHLPPPFAPRIHKPVDQMKYPDRVNVWQKYCEFRKLSTDFQVYSNRDAFQYVEAQMHSIKANYLDHFDSTALIDPRYL